MVHLTLYDNNNNGFMLDLFEAENIYLKKQFASISDFSIVGGYSQDFRVPMSDNNLKILSSIWNANNTAFDFSKKIKATLSDDTIQVASGHVQVKKVYSKGLTWHEVELLFFSTLPNISTYIGDKKIKDISTIADLNHDMIYANLAPDAILDGVIRYGLTERGKKWSEDSVDVANGARRIFDADSPLYVTELTPYVQTKYLFKQIFADAGFTYDNTTLDGLLQDIYIPFVVAQDLMTLDGIDQYYFYASTDDSTDVVSGAYFFDDTDLPMEEFADNGNDLSTSFIYTAPNTSSYTFGVKVILSMTDWNAVQESPPNTARIQLWDVDANQPLWFADIDEWWYETTNYFEPTLNLSVGQRIQMRIVLNDLTKVDVINPPFPTYTFNEHLVGFGCEFKLLSTVGVVFDAAANAPDYRQVDFVKDIIGMFNLAFVPDDFNPNFINIQFLQDYIASGDTLDWTKKQDFEKDIVLYAPSDEQSKKFTWSYSAGGEYLSKLFTDAGRIYGDYVIDNTLNDFATGTKELKLVASSTPLNEVPNTEVPIPKFVDQSANFVSPKARLLYLCQEELNIYMWDEVDEASYLTNIKQFSHYSNIIPDVASYDLNFAPETSLQQMTATPYNNLFNLYWRRYYNELYSAESRIMECYFDLDASDYLSVKFSDVIFVRDSYWRLIEINSFAVGLRQSVQCKLMKIVDVPSACEFTPVSSTLSGQILFSDGVDNDLDGNQTCCQLYGYRWNIESEKCYAFNATAGRPSEVSYVSRINLRNE
jgi:hypothetical protein